MKSKVDDQHCGNPQCEKCNKEYGPQLPDAVPCPNCGRFPDEGCVDPAACAAVVAKQPAKSENTEKPGGTVNPQMLMAIAVDLVGKAHSLAWAFGNLDVPMKFADKLDQAMSMSKLLVDFLNKHGGKPTVVQLGNFVVDQFREAAANIEESVTDDDSPEIHGCCTKCGKVLRECEYTPANVKHKVYYGCECRA